MENPNNDHASSPDREVSDNERSEISDQNPNDSSPVENFPPSYEESEKAKIKDTSIAEPPPPYEDGPQITSIQYEDRAGAGKCMSTPFTENAGMGKTVNNMQMPSHPIAECKAPSSTEEYVFHVTDRGCQVTSKYCKLFFPPNAVIKPVTIKMLPKYHREKNMERIIITPTVHFESSSSLTFEKNISVSLRTSYFPSEQDKPLKVKIKRIKNGNESEVTTITCVKKQRPDDFLIFETDEFCAFCGSLSADQCPYASRAFYSAIFVRRTLDQTQGIAQWMVWDDMPDSNEMNLNRFGEEHNQNLVEPESFVVGYNYNISLNLKRDDGVNFREPANLALKEKFGQKFDEKSQFLIGLNRTQSVMQLKYSIVATARDLPPIVIFDKSCNLDSSSAPIQSATTINVGDSATGIQINHPEARAANTNDQRAETHSSVGSEMQSGISTIPPPISNIQKRQGSTS